jgi:hypothetical protein
MRRISSTQLAGQQISDLSWQQSRRLIDEFISGDQIESQTGIVGSCFESGLSGWYNASRNH